MRTLTAAIKLLNLSIERHGGGWRGLRSVSARSMRVLRALGWRGLWHRVRAARPLATPASTPIDAVTFPQPSPLNQVQMHIGVMAHVFYADLIEELATDLANMPKPYVLMVSVVDEATRQSAQARFARLPRLRALHVRLVPNRGRDLAPMLTAFNREILALDLVCHVHTKKSLYTGSEQDAWRRHLIGTLLGNHDRIARILGTFQAMPTLGMVYPESFHAFPWWGHTWLSNLRRGRDLSARLGIAIDERAYIDFPAGSMFWARVDALRPLYRLRLSLNDFPAERGQTDGTTQHAIERLLGLIARQQGMVLGIMPKNDSDAWRSEGKRNWTEYFRDSVPQRIRFAAIEARVISFDVFDTLVTRPFLTPAGARACLAHHVKQSFGVNDFITLRERAEARARSQNDHDVDNTTIYAAMRELPEARDLPVTAIHELDLALEAQWLRPRKAMLEAARVQARAGKRVIAVSDMYMDGEELARALPTSITEVLQATHVSCDTGWRKDDGEAWRRLPALEHTEPAHWLHVGDNEHADVQLPADMGFLHPVHVLRPGALLDVVPALRPLRPSATQARRWQEQLWLGLIANRLAAEADREPTAFAPDFTLTTPDTFGYTVLGPLLFAYSAWLWRLTQARDASKLLFLSREGYLLQRAFERLRTAADATSPASSYLLVSRRGVNTPSVRTLDDLADIFNAPYTGSLHGLLEARLGERIAKAALQALGSARLQSEVYLPEMRQQIVAWLHPASDTILAIASEERDAYLAYWSAQDTGGTPIVADIGYAGTIQTRLAAITGQSLGGAYFALTAAARQVGHSGSWAEAHFHDGRDVAHDDTAPAMQHHLLLEAILTSPDGQFSRFVRHADGVKAVHRNEPGTSDRWAILERIHTGALAFIDDVCAVAGTDSVNMMLDTQHVQQPLQCVASGLWRLGPWASALHVEDHYTGHGDITIDNP